MPRATPIIRLEFRSCLLPALQAFLTASSTALAVILVMLWHPKRSRFIPFYSDATHNDPERIVLAIGENMACFCMPLVALVEYLHHSRLALQHPRLSVPPLLHCLLPLHRISTQNLVIANCIVTASTTLFFFVTANVPSKYPFTKPHQFAASALILTYALQATFKAILAHTFGNYEMLPDSDLEMPQNLNTMSAKPEDNGRDDCVLLASQNARNKDQNIGQGRGATWWGRHHMKVRLLLAVILWSSLGTTWLCFMGRVSLGRWGTRYDVARGYLSAVMAVIVHAATTSCVVLMVVMAIDLRYERLVLSGRAG